ncbi:MAG TPA: acyl-CoA dehydrogenase family protein [Candidatus Limnocylindria bacterium]|jgi:acyl-CoA dehydrogenase|nr:acyl-CoA dehydrogenase family protein [Candidatus Limnocylindria bacterium]
MPVTAETRTETKDWFATARELATDFASRAADHDANDTFVAENYQALKDAKLFSAPVPAELGGGGAGYGAHCEIIRTIARGCGSTALAYSMHSHLLQALIWRHRHNATPPAEPLLRRIAAEELILVSSGGSDWLEGSGTLTKKNGSYTFNARKIFGSGSPSGDLLLTTGIYEDPQAGPTVLHFGVNMRAPGVKVQDNWRTLGMRATGSNDIVIENVEIQDATVSVRRPKGKWHRFFDVISPIVWPLVGAAYLGVAEAARDIAIGQVAKKRDDPIVQQLVGEMDTELANARMAWEQMVAFGATDYEPSISSSDAVYKRKTIFSRAAVRSVYLAMEVTGGGSFFRSVGLERAFRDIQGIRFHPMHERRQYQFSGRVALGLDPV